MTSAALLVTALLFGGMTLLGLARKPGETE